jgi:hypothetical protein
MCAIADAPREVDFGTGVLPTSLQFYFSAKKLASARQIIAFGE